MDQQTMRLRGKMGAAAALGIAAVGSRARLWHGRHGCDLDVEKALCPGQARFSHCSSSSALRSPRRFTACF